MAIGTGGKSTLAVGVESTWGTPVAVTQRVPYVSETLSSRFNEILNPALLATAGRAFSDQGTRIVEGGFTAMFNYQLDDVVFKHFFGAQTQGTGNDATYDMQAALTDFLTIAIEKTISVWEFAGFMGSQLVVSGSPTDGIRYTLNGIAKALDLGSATNTSGVLSALGAPPKNGLFQNVTFQIAALGGALTAYRLSGFTLTIDRNLDAPETNQQDREQPAENDFRNTTLQITIPRYSDDTGFNGNQWHTWHNANTKLFATLGWTDGTNVKTFRLNKLQVTNPDGVNVTGPQALTQTIEFRCATDTEDDNTATDFDFTQEVELFEDG